jgi:hypothetical protein
MYNAQLLLVMRCVPGRVAPRPVNGYKKEDLTIRDHVGFFQTVRAGFAKATPTEGLSFMGQLVNFAQPPRLRPSRPDRLLQADFLDDYCQHAPPNKPIARPGPGRQVPH